MEKEFVPYQESLELKELGFNETCFGYFKNGQLSDILELVKNSEMINANNEIDDYIAAPTFSQAFRWFRKKYMLRVRNYVFVNYSGGISEGFEIFKYSKDTIDRIEALTYEEAELACLRKLIEIVKNKNKCLKQMY